MKFLNEQGQEISLKRAENLPGYEVTLAEDTVIDSAVNNPFFKGINVLQLPKKLKGFRDNPDLKKLLESQKLNTGVYLDLASDEYVTFIPNQELVRNERLIVVHDTFGSGNTVVPLVINFGLKKIKLSEGKVIGTVIVKKAIID